MRKMKSRSVNNEKLMKTIAALITFAALVILCLAVVNIASDSDEDSLRQLEKSVRRSVMACYASEGVYPPNIDYLKKHYGLQVDEERYIIFYDVFAGNLMPDITVLERAA